MTPEQQEKVRDNLGSAAIVGGSIILSQRQLAKAVLDPKGAKAVSMLSRAKDSVISPSGFTKLVVEPLANIFSEDRLEKEQIPTDQFDVRGFTFK